MDAYTVEYWADGAKVSENRRFEVYKTPAEMLVNSSVAKGELMIMPKQISKIYPDTQSDWWVYKPAKPEPEGGYGLIVFQDGAGPKGYALACLDNMIAKGDIPPCVAIFIQPRRDDSGCQIDQIAAVRRVVGRVRSVFVGRVRAGGGADAECENFSRSFKTLHCRGFFGRHRRVHGGLAAAG